MDLRGVIMHKKQLEVLAKQVAKECLPSPVFKSVTSSSQISFGATARSFDLII
jgi:hypothetical protein